MLINCLRTGTRTFSRTTIRNNKQFLSCGWISKMSKWTSYDDTASSRRYNSSQQQRDYAHNHHTPQTLQRRQTFDYFLVLDFEATCDQARIPNPQEIIEFPCLKVDARTMQVVSTFHSYVRPIHHPELSDFCTKLTGIVQEMVESEPDFRDAYSGFHSWLIQQQLIADNSGSHTGEKPQTSNESTIRSGQTQQTNEKSGHGRTQIQPQHTGEKPNGGENVAKVATASEKIGSWTFVTCGDWDLKVMLPNQCATSSMPVNCYFDSWINLKRSFSEHTHIYPKSLNVMLQQLQLQLVGRLHSGIDDCKNIARILSAMDGQGFIFKDTSKRLPAQNWRKVDD